MAGAIFVTALGTSVVIDHFRHRGDDWSRFDRRRVVVEDVEANDILNVRLEYGTDRAAVRLLGVVVPRESAGNARSRQATARVVGKTVVLKLEQPQTRDDEGKLLAYVYLDDADDLNLDLVREGLASADRTFQFSRRADFVVAEAEARRKGRGIWAR